MVPPVRAAVWIPFPSAALRPGMTPSVVITGLVPVIPIRMARRFSYRDGRDKPGHDVVEPESVIPGERSEGRGSRAG